MSDRVNRWVAVQSKKTIEDVNEAWAKAVSEGLVKSVPHKIKLPKNPKDWDCCLVECTKQVFVYHEDRWMDLSERKNLKKCKICDNAQRSKLGKILYE